jgi:hypothetical protein
MKTIGQVRAELRAAGWSPGEVLLGPRWNVFARKAGQTVLCRAPTQAQAWAGALHLAQAVDADLSG